VNWEQRLCTVLELSRSQYYRTVRGMRDYRERPRRELLEPTLAGRVEHLARQYVHYGHRKIHALVRRSGIEVSRYQIYMLLKRKNLLLPSTWRKDLRERSRALKQYLVKPTRPLELLQADITHVPVEGYGTYYVIDVIDYYSKYVLASIFADRHGTDVLIEACEEARREADRLGLTMPTQLKLLTDNGPAMLSRRFRRYIEHSPFKHLRTRSHHPETNGCIERYHQTLKYEEVWGAMYENPMMAKERIERFRQFYNTERIHQTLGYKTPQEVIEEWKRQQITYSNVA